MRTKLNLFARYAVSRRANHPKIMEALTAERKTYAIDEFETSFHKKEIKLNRYAEKLETRISKGDEQLISTDKWGIERYYQAPIMKPNEVVTARKDRSSWRMVTLIVFIFDTYFASMIVPFVLPGGAAWVKLLIGGCIAFLVILCSETGFKNLALYFEGKQLLKKGELSESDGPRVTKRLATAIAFITAGVLATFAIAMVRFIFLETVDVGINSHSALINQLNAKLNSGSKYAAFTTFILAFIVIGLFAYFSLQKNKYAIRYKLYRKYSKNINSINKLIFKISKLNTLFWHNIKDNLEAAWSVMLHIRRILRRSVDEDNRAKEEEYNHAAGEPGFVLDDDRYRYFETVASCNRDLFLYGIDESKEVRSLKLSWNTAMIRINTMIELYKSTHNYNNKNAARKPVTVQNAINTAILFVGLLFLSSCGDAPKSINAVAFVDLSGSVKPYVKQYYLQILHSLLSALTPGSSLVVLPIDGSTEKGSTEFINVRIPPMSFFENDLDPPSQKQALSNLRFETFKDSVLKAVEVGINQITSVQRVGGDSQQTDILGAFRLLEKYQDNANKSSKNTVLVLSDMLNCDKELDIEHRNYDKNTQSKIIDKLQKANLSDWQVLVLTGASKISDEKYLSTKYFWSAYLTSSHNRGLLYESGATSLIFKKIQELTKPDEDKLSFLN
jgi:hypothetical protein